MHDVQNHSWTNGSYTRPERAHLLDPHVGVVHQSLEAPRPIAHHLDVHGQELVAGRRGDGERVPLEFAQAPEWRSKSKCETNHARLYQAPEWRSKSKCETNHARLLKIFLRKASEFLVYIQPALKIKRGSEERLFIRLSDGGELT